MFARLSQARVHSVYQSHAENTPRVSNFHSSTPSDRRSEGGGGGGDGESECVNVRQLGGSGGMSPIKNLNLSLLKWLEMHQKLR